APASSSRVATFNRRAVAALLSQAHHKALSISSAPGLFAFRPARDFTNAAASARRAALSSGESTGLVRLDVLLDAGIDPLLHATGANPGRWRWYSPGSHSEGSPCAKPSSSPPPARRSAGHSAAPST